MCTSIHKAPLPAVKLEKLRDEVKYLKNPNGSITRHVINLGPHDIASHKRAYTQEKVNKDRYITSDGQGLQIAPLPFPWSREGLYELDDVEVS